MVQSDVSHGSLNVGALRHKLTSQALLVLLSERLEFKSKRRFSWSLALGGVKATFLMGKGDISHGLAAAKATLLMAPKRHFSCSGKG
jgi:hypothetical protein